MQDTDTKFQTVSQKNQGVTMIKGTKLDFYSVASPSPFAHLQICLLRRPSLCHGKVTISRGPAESCKMNKCSKPASLKKAISFVQRWCGQQTLSVPFLTIYLGGQLQFPPPPSVKPFLPPKCEAELLMIAVRIAVDLLDNEIIPFHSLLHSHLVCNSYCSSPSIS